jgi:hypothetical protein
VSVCLCACLSVCLCLSVKTDKQIVSRQNTCLVIVESNLIRVLSLIKQAKENENMPGKCDALESQVGLSSFKKNAITYTILSLICYS